MVGESGWMFMRVNPAHLTSVIFRTVSAVIIIFSLTTETVFSEETLSSVTQRMKPETAVRIAYQETRYLELLDEPWKGSGYLYSMPPDVMIKEQYYPAREIMAANGKYLYYYDPVDGVRHQGEMDRNDPASLHLAAIKSLITGDRRLMDEMYRTEFESNDEQWKITLTAKNNEETTLKIFISGLSGKEADQIIIRQADGDRSEFRLKKDKEGQEMEKKVIRLHKELLGD